MLTTACGKEEQPVDVGGSEENEKILSPAFGGEQLKFDNETFQVLTKTDGARENGYNVVDLVADDNLGDAVIVDSVLRRNDMLLENFEIKLGLISLNTGLSDFLSRDKICLNFVCK